MNLLHRLKPLSDNAKIKGEIKVFEKESNTILPPVFKTFLENFEFERLNQTVSEKILIPESNNQFEFENWKFLQDEEIGIEHIISPLKYIEAKENVYEGYEEDEVFVKDKVVIGNIFGGILLLVIEGVEKECIYVDFIADDKRYFKVADNIFHFFQQTEQEQRQTYRKSGLDRRLSDRTGFCDRY